MLQLYWILILITFFTVFGNSSAYSSAYPPYAPPGEEPSPPGPHVTQRDLDLSISLGKDVIDDFYSRYSTKKEVDLVFVLDRSGSVPREGWAAISRFINDILQHFTVDANNTRVAIVTFSSDVTVDINDLGLQEGLDIGGDNNVDPLNLDARKGEGGGNKCTLHKQIKETIQGKIPYGYTGTYYALAKAYEVLLEARPHAKKAVLVLTDGRSNVGPPPVRAANNILSLQWDPYWNETALGPQTEIYAFGIKDAYMPELNSIASPLPNHAFLIPTFEAFETFARRLHGGKQSERWLPTDQTRCASSCPGRHSHCMCGARRGHYSCVCDPGHERIGLYCSVCKKGYYKDSLSLTMCTRCPDNTTTEGAASTHRDQCHLLPGLQECSDLADIDGGWVFFVPGSHNNELEPTDQPCTGVRDGNSCHYSCNEGYWMQGTPILHCNRSGLWEGEPPTCSVIDCGNPKALDWYLPNTTINLLNGTTTFGAEIEVECDGHMVPMGSTHWVCDRHGKWTKPWNFQCSEIECLPLDGIQYSITLPESCSQSRQPFSTQCTVHCLHGFELVGPDTLTCEFDKKAMWSPEQSTYCKDIQPPQILCPNDLTVMLSDWTDNSTVIHIQPDQALADDNSANFTLSVSGVPQDNVFPVGHTFVTYQARDASTNENSCVRKIEVIEKRAGVLFCPMPEDVIMNSDERERHVSWEKPVFVDMMNNSLAYSCFPLGPFSVGSHLVTCSATDFNNVKCSFMINVKVPECAVPYQDKPPLHGALICGRPVDKHYPRVCRVHCQKGHELRGYEPDHQFICGWDGQWKELEQGWPHCYRSRRSNSALTIGQIHVAYSGKCVETKGIIAATFVDSVIKLLTVNSGPCSGDTKCTVREVNVICGGGRARRSAITALNQTLNQSTPALNESSPALNESSPALNESSPALNESSPALNESRTLINESEAVINGSESKMNETHPSADGIDIEYTLRVSLDHVDEYEITKAQQDSLLWVLNDAYFALEDEVLAGNLYLQIEDESVSVLTIDTVQVEEIELANCSQLSLESTDDYTRCLSCPPGTFYENDACVLCPSATYQDESGAEHCVTCPEGTSSPEGAYSPCQCVDKNTTIDYTVHNRSLDTPDNMMASSQCYVCSNLSSCTDDGSPLCGPLCLHGDCVTGSKDESAVMCECHEGYIGDRCDTVLDSCTDVLCHNGGSCQLDPVLNYTCACPQKYTGKHCEALASTCSQADSCLHGYCLDHQGSGSCLCRSGWHGPACEVQVTECREGICESGGRCSYEQDNTVVCHCLPGYSGDRCQYTVDKCLSTSCENNSTCVLEDREAVCVCQEGYAGTYCESEVAPCQNVTCQNNGTCIVVQEAAFCKCLSGFVEEYCNIEYGTDFDLVFDSGHMDDFVSLRTFDSDHTSVSLCVWMRTNDVTRYGTLFSYSVDVDDDDSGIDMFTLHDYGRLQLVIKGEAANTRIALNNGDWNHLCTTWENTDGTWAAYVNGSLEASGQGLAVGGHIQKGGYAIIGQRQSTVGDGFYERESFIGEMHQLNIYSYNISAPSSMEFLVTSDSKYNVCVTYKLLGWTTYNEHTDNQYMHADKYIGNYYFGVNAYDVSGLYNNQCTQTQPGDVLTWSQVIGHVHNQVKVREQSWCMDVNDCLTNTTLCPSISDSCVDRKGGYDCVPHRGCQDTACFHGGSCHTDQQDKPYCTCTDKYTGVYCESFLPDACSELQCEHGGLCVHGVCTCTAGYTGMRCEQAIDNCLQNTCYNGGTCYNVSDASVGYECECTPLWTGRHCLIFFQPACLNSPCLSEGVCIEGEEQPGYYCNCTEEGMGPNCEESPCLSQPCLNGGSCVTYAADNMTYTCVCPLGYVGDNCDIRSTLPTTTQPPTSPPTTTPINYCVAGRCSNGGTCLSLANGFRCECLLGFSGVYCMNELEENTYVYHAQVSLVAEYSPELSRNDSFKDRFVQTIHSLYLRNNILAESKLRVKVTSVSEGSVLVAFDVTHTNYTEAKSPNFEQMRQVVAAPVMLGKLGPWKTNQHDFYFTTHKEPVLSGVSLWVVCGVVVCVALVALIITVCLCYRRRKYRHQKPQRMNNLTQMVHFRIRNQTGSPPGKCPPSPTVRINSVPEDIYAEPEVYSACPGGAGELPELSPRFPSKRGKEINLTWGNRQSIPLPPRPDEKQGPLVRPGHTPPPTYKDAISKNIKVDNANINPNGGNNSGPIYFTPISESRSDVQLAMPEDDSSLVCDDTYLTPRETRQVSTTPTSMIMSEIQDNIDNEEAAYLTPVSVNSRKQDNNVKSNNEEADYLTAVSINSREQDNDKSNEISSMLPPPPPPPQGEVPQINVIKPFDEKSNLTLNNDDHCDYLTPLQTSKVEMIESDHESDDDEVHVYLNQLNQQQRNKLH